MQLVELQEAWSRLEPQGFALFALSYDPQPALAEVAERRGITYCLLSDEGSLAIRNLGLLNEHLEEQHAVYGIVTRDEQRGVAYPGTFVLDETGTITARYFEQSYRVRPTAALFEAYATGAAPTLPEQAATSSEQVEVQAWTDAPTYRPYQQLRLHVLVTPAPGVHVYGHPIPDGYTALQVTVEGQDHLEGLSVGQPQLPAPQPLRVEGLDEDFVGYTGAVTVTVPLMLTQNLGQTSLGVTVQYQACTDAVCYPPGTARLAVTLRGLDLIRD